MTSDTFAPWLHATLLLGVPLYSWAVAGAATLASYLVLTFALRFALKRAGRIAAHTSNRIDDALIEVLAATNRGLIALMSLLIGVGLLELSARWSSRVEHLWFIVMALQLGLWLNRAIGIALARYIAQHSNAGMAHVSASATLLSWGLRTVVWAVVLLAMLSNVGVNITAFVASLGVGGIAVALAVQNILSDLFASLSIAVDKPFEIGDFIVVDGMAGTVANVGLKTTRIRSLSGEQIVMSNTELLKQTVSNYKRMETRRIVFKFGVTYDATPEQAAEIPQIVKKIVQASDTLRFDRAHFLAFGESSLDYEVVYIVLDPDYNLYMDQQQRINLELMRELAARGIEFAFPTRTVYVMRGAGDASFDAETESPPRHGNGAPGEPRNRRMPN